MASIRPILRPGDVEQALESLRSAEVLPPHHPLRQFFSFQEALSRPDALGGDYGELAVWLALVEDFLLAHLSPRGPDAASQLRADFGGKTFEQSCSVLYYRYCRYDLEWSFDDMADIIGLGERTIQRRHVSGIEYFTQHLVEREMHLRRSRWEDVMRARLPLPFPDDLYGREAWLSQLERALLEVRQPILLTGPSGLGKTILACALAHKILVDFDEVIWLSLSPYQAVIPSILEAFGMDDEAQMRPYMASRRVLVILDHFDEAHLSALGAESPLWLSYTLALSRGVWDHWAGLWWQVPSVSEDEAWRFFERVRGDLSADVFADLSFGGNLGLLLRQMNELRRVSELSPKELAVLAWWDRFPDIPLGLIQRLLGSGEWHPRHGDIDWSLWWACFSGASAEEWRIALGAITWAELSSDLVGQIFRQARVFASGLRAAWAAVLAILGAETDWGKSPYGSAFIRLEQARLARLAGLYVSAYEELWHLAGEVGASGWFDLQALCWLEMAWIAYYQERFELADRALSDVERLFGRFGIKDEQVLLLRASLAVETGQDLENFPVNNSFFPIRVESFLRRGQGEEALAAAQQFLSIAPKESSVSARALNDLAGVYAFLGDLSVAIGYQTQALNLLSFLGDELALARALNNLASFYFQQKDLALAREHWQASLDIFLGLQDRWGLQTVRANLALIS